MASKETFARKGTLTSGGVPVQDFINTRNVDDPTNPGNLISVDVASQGSLGVDDLGNPTFRAVNAVKRTAVAADATVKLLLAAPAAGETRLRWEVHPIGGDIVLGFGTAAALATASFYDATHTGNGWVVFDGQKDGEWFAGVWQGEIQVIALNGASPIVRLKEYKAVTP